MRRGGTRRTTGLGWAHHVVGPGEGALTGHELDPAKIHTKQDLLEAMRLLHRGAHNGGVPIPYDEIRSRMSEIGRRERPGVPLAAIKRTNRDQPKDWLEEGRLPSRPGQVVAFVLACRPGNQDLPNSVLIAWAHAVQRVNDNERRAGKKAAAGAEAHVDPALNGSAPSNPAPSNPTPDDPTRDERPLDDPVLEDALRSWARRVDVRWSEDLARARAVSPRLEVTWALRGTDRVGVAADLAPAVLDGLRRRVMVIGRSGSGKSVLVLELVRALSQRAVDGTPYPVLLGPRSAAPEELLAETLERRLVLDDPALGEQSELAPGRTLAWAAIHHARVMPVLDGLDEVGEHEDDRNATLEWVRSWLREDERRRAVVACRSREPIGSAVEGGKTDERGADVGRGEIGGRVLEDLVDRWGFAVAEVRDVDVNSARAYLVAHAGGPEWFQLMESRVIAEAMRRPLPIWLASVVYGDRPTPDAFGDIADVASPAEPDGDDAPGRPAPPRPADLVRGEPQEPGEITERLIRAFLPLAFTRRGKRGRTWPAVEAQRWLRTIAYGVSGERAGGLAWWSLAGTGPGWLIAAIVAAPGALAVGGATLLVPGLGSGLGSGILVAVAVAAVTAAAVATTSTQPSAPGRAWYSGRIPELGVSLLAGLSAALLGSAVGGVVGSALGWVDHPLRGFVGALGVGIAAGAVFGPAPALVGGVLGGAVVPFAAGTGAGWPAAVLNGVAAGLASAVVVHRHLGPDLRPAWGFETPDWRVWLGVALTCEIGLGLWVGATAGVGQGVVVGLAAGPLGGWAAARGAARVRPGGFAADPLDLLRHDRRAFLQVLVSGGTAFGLGAGLAVGWPVGIAAFLVVGVTAGAARTAWPTFLVAKVLWALRGELPLRLVTFLDDALEEKVLRLRGGAYTIRHQEIADHLLRHGPTTAKTGP